MTYNISGCKLEQLFFKDNKMKIEQENDIANKIFEKWKAWTHWGGEFDQIWFGYDSLSDETGVDVKTLKKFMKLLIKNKIAYHSPTVNNDYEINGSGIFMHEKYNDKEWNEIKEVIDNERKNKNE